MKISIRKTTIGLALFSVTVASLVACGTNDQNQITATGHRGAGNHCGGTAIKTDSSNTQTALSVTVTGDTQEAMADCALSKPNVGMGTSSPNVGLGTSSPSGLQQAGKQAVAQPVTSAPVTNAATSADTSKYNDAINNCQPTDVTPPDQADSKDANALIAEKKTGTYQLTKVVYVANSGNIKSQYAGMISMTSNGFISAPFAAGQALPANVKHTLCGGWPVNHGALNGKLMLPNEINAADMTTLSQRKDIFKVVIDQVTDIMQIDSGNIPLTNKGTGVQALQQRLNATKQAKNSAAVSSPQSNATYYEDDKGVLSIMMQMDLIDGPFHQQATVLGTYTLKSN